MSARPSILSTRQLGSWPPRRLNVSVFNKILLSFLLFFARRFYHSPPVPGSGMGMFSAGTRTPPFFLGAWSPPLLRLVSLVAVALATVQAPTPSVGPQTRFGVQASGASPFAPPAIPRRESRSANINRCQVRWQRLMFSEAAPRPRSRHSPCWGPSRLVRSSPSPCLTRNGCFTGFFLIIFPALPFPFPLSSVQSPFVLFVTPPALVGVTRCKGTQCGRGCLSNRPSTYPLGRAPNSLRGPGLWCLALCTPCHSPPGVA